MVCGVQLLPHLHKLPAGYIGEVFPALGESDTQSRSPQGRESTANPRIDTLRRCTSVQQRVDPSGSLRRFGGLWSASAKVCTRAALTPAERAAWDAAPKLSLREVRAGAAQGGASTTLAHTL